MKNARLPSVVATLLLLALPLVVSAQKKKASDYTVEDFFKLPEYGLMELSPNAKRISGLVPFKGRHNLVVVDLVTRKTSVLTSFENMDVYEKFWVNNDRICLRVADIQDVNGRFNYKGTYCIDHDARNLRDFTRLGVRDTASTDAPVVFIDFLRPTAERDSPEYFIAARFRSRDSQDVYRFNTATGRYQILTADAPPSGYVTRWVMDHNDVPRVAVSVPKRENKNALLKRIVWYRDSADSKWEQISSQDMYVLDEEDGNAFSPIAFDYDNTTLFVASRRGRDRNAIYRYDTKARKLGEMVFDHPLVDVNGGLVGSRTKKKLMGIQFQADKPVSRWLDADLDKLQKQVDATFPKTANLLVLPRDNDEWALVYSYSDVDPGEYFLMNRTKPSVEPLVKTRGWLDPNLMSERRFIVYKARDGRSIPAYVTIPKASSGKKLPLIVHIHGGPHVRSYYWAQWGRPEAQFFASRGYVVLEPEPRGSTGWGFDHHKSSYKQWGLAMQDDITDGALHLAKEGIVDKDRMCLFGGSYGGYASAMGIVKDPELWKCSAPYVAVTDLLLMQGTVYSDTARLSDYYDTDFKRVVGDPDADREMLIRASPARHADKVKAPVLLVMGSEDERVPLVQGEAFKKALEAAGKKVDYVVYNGEAHGFTKPENVYDFYGRLEKFFATYLK